MQSTIVPSETLIGSLCREADYIRNRYRHLLNTIRTCKSNVLAIRLKGELDYLQRRRNELSSLAKGVNINKVQDPIIAVTNQI